MNLYFRFRRWLNTWRLRRRGAQLFRSETRDDRQLYLRDHYWLYRGSWGFPHAMALRCARESYRGWVRVKLSMDAVDRMVNELIETLNGKKVAYAD